MTAGLRLGGERATAAYRLQSRADSEAIVLLDGNRLLSANSPRPLRIAKIRQAAATSAQLPEAIRKIIQARQSRGASERERTAATLLRRSAIVKGAFYIAGRAGATSARSSSRTRWTRRWAT